MISKIERLFKLIVFVSLSGIYETISASTNYGIVCSFGQFVSNAAKGGKDSCIPCGNDVYMPYERHHIDRCFNCPNKRDLKRTVKGVCMSYPPMKCAKGFFLEYSKDFDFKCIRCKKCNKFTSVEKTPCTETKDVVCECKPGFGEPKKLIQKKQFTKNIECSPCDSENNICKVETSTGCENGHVQVYVVGGSYYYCKKDTDPGTIICRAGTHLHVNNGQEQCMTCGDGKYMHFDNHRIKNCFTCGPDIKSDSVTYTFSYLTLEKPCSLDSNTVLKCSNEDIDMFKEMKGSETKCNKCHSCKTVPHSVEKSPCGEWKDAICGCSPGYFEIYGGPLRECRHCNNPSATCKVGSNSLGTCDQGLDPVYVNRTHYYCKGSFETMQPVIHPVTKQLATATAKVTAVTYKPTPSQEPIVTVTCKCPEVNNNSLRICILIILILIGFCAVLITKLVSLYL